MATFEEIKIWNRIPNSIKDLHNLFKQHEKKLFLVGGCLRDYIIGTEPNDFDLTTDAIPDEIIEILKDYKINKQGSAFGVIVVYTENGNFEIATFRSDIYDDKLGKTRNPDIKISTIEEDVKRRDITISALFFDLDKQEIIDLVGGNNDIERKIIRFVGNPKLRIMEDPLRILRSMRYSARYGFKIEENSHIAISANVHKLSIITKDRIWTEISNAFDQSKDFYKYFIDFVGYGVAKHYFDGFDLSGVYHSDVKQCSHLELYFANILRDKDIPNLTKKLVDLYRVPKDLARRVEFLCDLYKKGIKAEQIPLWYKNSRDISHDMIQEWYDMCEINTPINKAFLDYKPVANATKLMETGLKGNPLGQKIDEINIEHCKSLIK